MTVRFWAAALAGLAIAVWPRPAGGAPWLDRIEPLRGRSSPTGQGRERPPGAKRWGRFGRRLSTGVRGGGVRLRWSPRDRESATDRDLLAFLESLSGALRAGLPTARAFAVVLSSMVTAADHPGAPSPNLEAASMGEADPEHPAPAHDGRHQIGGLYRLARRLAALSATGAPLGPAWRQAARDRASPALVAVAAAWAMTERHGAPLVDVLDSVVGALREGARAEAAVETALAAPRATAALLAALPLGGVVLGELVGVHPVSTLVGTPAGRVIAGAGLVCTIGGRIWMSRLVARAVRP